MCPCFLQFKQVTVSSVMKIQNMVSSKLISIELICIFRIDVNLSTEAGNVITFFGYKAGFEW